MSARKWSAYNSNVQNEVARLVSIEDKTSPEYTEQLEEVLIMIADCITRR